ncbi:MAG: hypothetical protein ACOX54_01065 [Christensenellales bacterium]|jgi:hypothetical protein|nr:hypothetical protein [Christensenellaceae bacterium]
MFWYILAAAYLFFAIIGRSSGSAATITGAMAILTTAVLPSLIFVILGKLTQIQKKLKELENETPTQNIETTKNADNTAPAQNLAQEHYQKKQPYGNVCGE